MFMARLMLAISAFNRIIDTTGFQSNILSKVQLTAPIAQRYASGLAYIDTMMTDYVHMIELTADREMSLLVRSDETEDRATRQYVQTSSEIVAHTGLTLLREDNQSLQITAMELLAQLSPFRTHLPPFMHFILFLTACTTEIRMMICAILANDATPERNGRSKMNFTRGEAQVAAMIRLNHHISKKLTEGHTALDIILKPQYNLCNKTHVNIHDNELLQAITDRFRYNP
jgi:hypothetical protein